MNIEDNTIREEFNPENYAVCSECRTLIETTQKTCPYCGANSI